MLSLLVWMIFIRTATYIQIWFNFVDVVSDGIILECLSVYPPPLLSTLLHLKLYPRTETTGI